MKTNEINKNHIDVFLFNKENTNELDISNAIIQSLEVMTYRINDKEKIKRKWKILFLSLSFMIALISFGIPLTILIIKEIAKDSNKYLEDPNTFLIVITTILGMISLVLLIFLVLNILKFFNISLKGFGFSFSGSGFETHFENNSESKTINNKNIIYKILKYFQTFLKGFGDERMYFCFYAFNKNDQVLTEYKKCLKSFLKTQNINIELIDGELICDN